MTRADSSLTGRGVFPAVLFVGWPSSFPTCLGNMGCECVRRHAARALLSAQQPLRNTARSELDWLSIAAVERILTEAGVDLTDLTDLADHPPAPVDRSRHGRLRSCLEIQSCCYRRRRSIRTARLIGIVRWHYEHVYSLVRRGLWIRCIKNYVRFDSSRGGPPVVDGSLSRSST